MTRGWASWFAFASWEAPRSPGACGPICTTSIPPSPTRRRQFSPPGPAPPNTRAPAVRARSRHPGGRGGAAREAAPLLDGIRRGVRGGAPGGRRAGDGGPGSGHGEPRLLRWTQLSPGGAQFRDPGWQPRRQRIRRRFAVHAGRVGPVSHARGTLGMSTRGRDTGDAQVFINLVDNSRLDYDYTVWGRVVKGWLRSTGSGGRRHPPGRDPVALSPHRAGCTFQVLAETQEGSMAHLV